MKLTHVKFGRLRQLLDDLGFAESRQETFWKFEHRPSKAMFLFRPYQLDDHVTLVDLVTTKSQLDWRGLLSADAFEDSLQKTPA